MERNSCSHSFSKQYDRSTRRRDPLVGHLRAAKLRRISAPPPTDSESHRCLFKESGKVIRYGISLYMSMESLLLIGTGRMARAYAQVLEGLKYPIIAVGRD